MAIELIKMDGRHTGRNYFTHYANFVRLSRRTRVPMIRSASSAVSNVRAVSTQDLVKEFVQCRTWCWEHFGPSCEVDIYDDAVHSFAFGPEKSDPDWAWVEKDYGRRIYFKNEDIAGMFALMWCQ